MNEQFALVADQSVLGPRSRLHRLEPQGLGTPGVEAMTSYLLRLAASHALPVGSLAVDLVGPELGRTRVYGEARTDRSSFFNSSIYRGPQAINGVGDYGELWLGAIQRLVLRDDLAPLSMVSWRRALSARGLLRDHLAACAHCLHEAAVAGRTIHEPLLWSIAQVTTCPLHGCQLLQSCPHCATRSPLLGWDAQVGHCRRCGSWLGSSICDEQPGSEWESWISASVGRLLELPLERRIAGGTMARAITQAVARSTNGNAAAFARAIGRSKSLVTEWRQGRAAPTLESLLRIAAYARLDFVALVRGSAVADPEPPARSTLGAWAREVKSARDWGVVESQLEAALALDPPQSFAALCRDLRLDAQSVRERFPALAGQLVSRRRRWSEHQRNERCEVLAGAVHAAVVAICEVGEHPSRRRVEALLPTGASLREDALRTAWRESIATHQ